MSKKILVRSVVLSAAMVAAGALVGSLAVGADAGPIAARMDAFSTANGANYFATQLEAAGHCAGRGAARRGRPL